MPAIFDLLGRVQRKFLPCGVPIDPDSCPCPNVEISQTSFFEEESTGKGDGGATPAGSCQSLNKLASNDIEISICFNRVFSIFCRTLKKLELSASLPVLFQHPEVRHILNRENFRDVTDAFHQYFYIEPCHWSCSESVEASEPSKKSSKMTESSTNDSKSNQNVYRAIEILNGYTEIREIVKQLCPQYSEQAQLFLRYVKYFFEHTLKRISTSPEEHRAKELRYRKLWRENEKAKKDLTILAAVLEEQRKQHDMEMEVINVQCEKDLATVKRINRKCKEDINHDPRIRTERKMMMAYKASEMKQKEIREDVSNAEIHLKKIRTLNLALKKEARDKRFKIESQLLGIINKYDTEIGEKQKQMELLILQFETDKKKKEDLEAEIERQTDLYDAFMKEKQDAEDAIINEKLAKLMMTRAVKIIQRWWHSMREQRKAKLAKKKTKNKKHKKKK